MLKLVSARDPKWTSPEKVSIDVIARFEGVDEDFPFTATPWDEMEHGKDIFERAKAGEFGSVQDWQDVPYEEKIQQARHDRNVLLVELDNIVNNPLRWNSYTEEYKQQLATYRQYLLDVPDQEGFPYNVVWPNKPWE